MAASIEIEEEINRIFIIADEYIDAYVNVFSVKPDEARIRYFKNKLLNEFHDIPQLAIELYYKDSSLIPFYSVLRSKLISEFSGEEN